MGMEGKPSEGQNNIQAHTPLAGTAANTGAPPRGRIKSNTKPRTRKPGSKKGLDPSVAQIVIAFLGLIGTITGAWFAYKANRPDPTPTPFLAAPVVPSPTPLFTDIPATFTPTPLATLAPSFTVTPLITAIPSETVTLPPQPILIVRLAANKTSGKAPLAVKLDARASYMTELDGRTYVCRNGPCFYTWKVYSNGQQIGKSVTGSGGTFDYKFGKKGIYTITVWVCRGRDGVDCAGSGIQIVVS